MEERKEKLIIEASEIDLIYVRFSPALFRSIPLFNSFSMFQFGENTTSFYGILVLIIAIYVKHEYMKDVGIKI